MNNFQSFVNSMDQSLPPGRPFAFINQSRDDTTEKATEVFRLTGENLNQNSPRSAIKKLCQTFIRCTEDFEMDVDSGDDDDNVEQSFRQLTFKNNDGTLLSPERYKSVARALHQTASRHHNFKPVPVRPATGGDPHTQVSKHRR